MTEGQEEGGKHMTSAEQLAGVNTNPGDIVEQAASVLEGGGSGKKLKTASELASENLHPVKRDVPLNGGVLLVEKTKDEKVTPKDEGGEPERKEPLTVEQTKEAFAEVLEAKEEKKKEAATSEPKEEQPPQGLMDRIQNILKNPLTPAAAFLAIDEIIEDYQKAEKLAELSKKVRGTIKKEKETTRGREMSPREENEERIRTRVERHLTEDCKGEKAKKLADRIMLQREIDPNSSYYLLLKSELGKHDPETERTLLKALGVLVNEAYDPKLPEEKIWSGIKDYASDMQKSMGRKSWKDAQQSVQDYDVSSREDDLKLKNWWSRDFQGMLGDYRDNILDHMNIAMAKAKRDKAQNIIDDDSRKEEIEKQNRVLNTSLAGISKRPWDKNTPSEVLGYARQHLDYLEEEEQRKQREQEERRKQEHPEEKSEWEEHGGITFQGALTEINTIESNLRGRRPTQDEQGRMNELTMIMSQYITDIDKAGYLIDVHAELNRIRKELQRLIDKNGNNNLTEGDVESFNRDLSGCRSYTSEINKVEQGQKAKDFPAKGAKAWVFNRELDKLQESFESENLQPRQQPDGRGMGEDAVVRLLTSIDNKTATAEDIENARKIASAVELAEIYPLAVRNMTPIPSMELGYPEFLKDVWLNTEMEEVTGRKISELSREELRQEIVRRENLRLEWKAIGKISSGCANKIDGDKPLHPNPEAASVTNKEFNALNAKRGVFEAVSLYTVFLLGDERGTRERGIKVIQKDKDGNDMRVVVEDMDINQYLLGNVQPEEGPERELWDHLKEETPDGIFSIQNKENFEAMRDSVSYWLCVNRGLTWQEAQEASVNAWNMVYLAYLPEYASSKFVHDVKKDPDKQRLNVGITQLIMIKSWETIRPQDRFEKKLKMEKKDREDDMSEAWGPAGPWAVAQKNKSRLFGKFNVPNVYPPITTPTAFHLAKDENGYPLIDVYHWYGTQLIANPETVYSPPKLSTSSEGPYSSFQFDHLDYAQELCFILTGKKGIDLTKLGNIYENLKFRSGRSLLTMILHGINNKKTDLTPVGGWENWEYAKRKLKKDFPLLFDD